MHVKPLTILLLSTLLSILIIPLLTFTNSINAQESDPIFDLQLDSPLIAHHDDDRGIDGGAVIYHDGLFHMFHNGFRTWPGESVVRYSTSTDGLHWELAAEQPVFTTEDVEYAEVMMAVSSGLVLEDGTWVLYFFTWQTFSIQYGPGEIGRATAPDPTGPWTPDSAPILVQGSEGEWDSGQLSIPSVVQLEDGSFMMFYTASDESGFMQIGMATSEDGIEWTKHDDPATTESPYAESDPVLFAGEDDAWDRNAAYQPNVVVTSDGWIMVYKSFSGRGSEIGIATSDDGITWTKFDGNPVMRSRDIPDARGFGLPELTYQEDTYLLYIPLGSGSNTSDLFLATHDGHLFED